MITALMVPRIGTRVLAGDVGGTKTVIAIYERAESGWIAVAVERVASADHAGIEAPARALLDLVPGKIAAAAIGVAGPVREGCAKVTNLPWRLEARALAAALGIARVHLMNDFEASALGLLELSPDRIEVLQGGRVAAGGHIAVLGAGTGLGEAILVPTERGVRVLATEGGHADLAPRNEIEDGLVRFLRRRSPDHVSVERAVSGPGLAAIHEYVIESGIAPSSPDVLTRIALGDPGAVIGELGAAGMDPGCARAVEIFLSLYGAEAGNLALKTLPTGGLFVAGGIAPKLIEALRRGAFLEAFLAKGRMRAVLEEIRVAVVTDPSVGLLGAAAFAGAMLEAPA